MSRRGKTGAKRFYLRGKRPPLTGKADGSGEFRDLPARIYVPSRIYLPARIYVPSRIYLGAGIAGALAARIPEPPNSACVFSRPAS